MNSVLCCYVSLFNNPPSTVSLRLPSPPPQGSVVSVLESAALCAFVIIVSTLVGPLPTLLLIPGIYGFTGMLRTCCCCCSYFQFKGASRSQYDTECTRKLKRVGAILDNPFFGFVGMATQLAGILGAGALALYNAEIWSETVARADPFLHVVMVKMVSCMVGIPILLSILWSAAVQKLIYHSCLRKKDEAEGVQSRNSQVGLPASRRGGMLAHFIQMMHAIQRIHTKVIVNDDTCHF